MTVGSAYALAALGFTIIYNTSGVINFAQGEFITLIGMLAAREADADGFISLSGPAERASTLLRRQLGPKLPPDLARANDKILAALERGQRPGKLPAQLQAIYRPSVQPYMASWISVAQGTTDIQVDTLQAALLAKANPAARLLEVEGMNHVLKQVPADPARQLASYSDPSLPLAPALAGAAAEFIHALPRLAQERRQRIQHSVRLLGHQRVARIDLQVHQACGAHHLLDHLACM
eukprot:gene30962-34944_t